MKLERMSFAIFFDDGGVLNDNSIRTPQNIENLWESKTSFDFFHAWEIRDDSGKFRYFVSKT